MKLSEIKQGQAVFIDANIFIYHFAGVSDECKQFLKSCAQKRFTAFIATSVLIEVCHRLMTIEAVKLGLVKSRQPSASLQKNPTLVKKLSAYYTQTTNILSWGFQIIPPPPDIIIRSQIYRQRFGLLTNDSLIPIYMELANTTNLASADKVFNSIPHLHLYSPSDIHL
jgi:predicted nucleic acid-binding protein